MSMVSCNSKQDTLTLAFLGDIMLGIGVAVTLEEEDLKDVFEVILPQLQGADLALANLESPFSRHPEDLAISASQEDGCNLCADMRFADVLKYAGLDVVSTANNHTLDCRIARQNDTRHTLDQAGITPIESGYDPIILTVGDKRLALLAFNDVLQGLDEDRVLQGIHLADTEADWVIVSIHWGLEYQAGASPRQKRLAQNMADAGADLIWGHHPHVLQPVEWLGRDGSRPPTLVMYSLGNALFDQTVPRDAQRSALLMVALGADGIRSVEAVPFVIQPGTYRLTLPDPEEKEMILQRLNYIGGLD